MIKTKKNKKHNIRRKSKLHNKNKQKGGMLVPSIGDFKQRHRNITRKIRNQGAFTVIKQQFKKWYEDIKRKPIPHPQNNMIVSNKHSRNNSNLNNNMNVPNNFHPGNNVNSNHTISSSINRERSSPSPYSSYA
jgi:hypothetical protein